MTTHLAVSDDTLEAIAAQTGATINMAGARPTLSVNGVTYFGHAWPEVAS